MKQKNLCKTNLPLPQTVQKIVSLKIQENTIYSTAFLELIYSTAFVIVYFKKYSSDAVFICTVTSLK